jgi:hypothetical protein
MLLLAPCAAVSDAPTAFAAHEIVTGLAAVGAELVVVVVTCAGAGSVIERHCRELLIGGSQCIGSLFF